MRPDRDEEPVERLVTQSLTDVLYQESKALAGGNVPFPAQGGFGGNVPVYSSWEQWDRATDLNYGGGQASAVNYQAKIGDLAQSSLLVSAIRWLGNVWPQAPLMVKIPKGEANSQQDDNVDFNHPLVKLWNRPNKYYSGSTLRKGLAFSWILKSEAYVLKFFNNALTEPVELWWEPHWTIRAAWPEDGSEFIDHYEVQRNGQWIPIPVENVIHFRDGLSPYNQRQGFSGVPSILREIYGDSQAAEYYATLMGGSGTPPFMVSLDASMRIEQGQIDALTADLISKTTGRRRGRPIVLKGGKAYKLGFNPKELDLRSSRYSAEERFCAVMGIPGVVLELGSAQEHSIYHNVAEGESRAWDQYVKPLLSHIAEELDVQLLEDFEGEGTDKYCEHDLSKVQALQEDQDKKSKRVGQQYGDEIIMRSEARSALNLGPSDPAKPDDDKVFKSSVTQNLLPPGGTVPVRVSETIGTPVPGTAAKPGTKLKAPLGKKPPLAAVKALTEGEIVTKEELDEVVSYLSELAPEQDA